MTQHDISTRTFYIKSRTEAREYCDGQGGFYKRPVFFCQAWENGEIFKEWANGKITQRYQANVYAIMSVVIELSQAGYKGEITAYIPDKLIVDEANHDEHYPFKNGSIEELTELINYCWKAKPYRLTRWIYLGEAFKRAKLNGIDLNIKLLDKNNIEIINSVMSQLLGKAKEKTDQPKR